MLIAHSEFCGILEEERRVKPRLSHRTMDNYLSQVMETEVEDDAMRQTDSHLSDAGIIFHTNKV